MALGLAHLGKERGVETSEISGDTAHSLAARSSLRINLQSFRGDRRPGVNATHIGLAVGA